MRADEVTAIFLLSGIGCADDIVLWALPWCAMQHLLKVFECAAHDLDMFFNTVKSVCIRCNPKMPSEIVTSTFPFVFNGNKLVFALFFKYLDAGIDVDLAADADIK